MFIYLRYLRTKKNEGIMLKQKTPININNILAP